MFPVVASLLSRNFVYENQPASQTCLRSYGISLCHFRNDSKNCVFAWRNFLSKLERNNQSSHIMFPQNNSASPVCVLLILSVHPTHTWSSFWNSVEHLIQMNRDKLLRLWVDWLPHFDHETRKKDRIRFRHDWSALGRHFCASCRVCSRENFSSFKDGFAETFYVINVFSFCIRLSWIFPRFSHRCPFASGWSGTMKFFLSKST